ncbi:hypothetical protein K438DRAFT_1975651 [Mycena galopus ATCC 62051]|nr:hypothetical protein K438DRAFT_1975651 [Mycena galopus ATCC 62051]
MLVADPSNFFPQLVIYATFNIFATCGLLALLTVTLLVQSPSTNPSLVNLEVIFIISSSTSSALVWTGHARNLHPPFALCLLNASAVMSNIPLMAGAALSLVTKVWGTAMIIWHPRFARPLEWIMWTPFLILFPFISAVPIFVAGVALGLEHQNQVFRGSPFYCVVNLDTPQAISTIFGAIFTLTSLVLAAWTSVQLIRTRLRFDRQRFTNDPGSVSLMFAIRVLLFSVFVGAAFVSGIFALTSTFDAVIPDIVVASCGVGAFFIFASAKPILDFVFCHHRDSREKPILSTMAPSWGSGPVTPQDFALSSMTATHTINDNVPIKSGKPPPISGAFAEGEIHVTRVVETLDEEGKTYWTAI